MIEDKDWNPLIDSLEEEMRDEEAWKVALGEINVLDFHKAKAIVVGWLAEEDEGSMAPFELHYFGNNADANLLLDIAKKKLLEIECEGE